MANSPFRLARKRVMADLKSLATDAEARLRATADSAGDRAKEAREGLVAALEKAKETYEDLQDQGIASAKQAAKQADETIRSHTYTSIAIAFSIGLVLGSVLRRK